MTNEEMKTLFQKITDQGFTGDAGFKLRAFDKGAVTLEVATKPELTQFLGYVHAGVVTGLADHAAGATYATMLPDGKACLTIELKINFLKPAAGDTLAAEARMVSTGKSIGVVQSDVYGEKDGKRTLCATALITLHAINVGG